MNFEPKRFNHRAYKKLLCELYTKDCELAHDLWLAEKSGDTSAQEIVAGLLSSNSDAIVYLEDSYGIYESLRHELQDYYNEGLVPEYMVKNGWNFRDCQEWDRKHLHSLFTFPDDAHWDVRNIICNMLNDVDEWLCITK